MLIALFRLEFWVDNFHTPADTLPTTTTASCKKYKFVVVAGHRQPTLNFDVALRLISPNAIVVCVCGKVEQHRWLRRVDFLEVVN